MTRGGPDVTFCNGIMGSLVSFWRILIRNNTSIARPKSACETLAGISIAVLDDMPSAVFLSLLPMPGLPRFLGSACEGT